MEKNKKNEELQSRREFFKKAAKSTLPILGAIALAGTPAIMKAVEVPMGCSADGCSATCATSCYNGCKGSCKGCTGCNTTCQGFCKYGCYTSNK